MKFKVTAIPEIYSRSALQISVTRTDWDDISSMNQFNIAFECPENPSLRLIAEMIEIGLTELFHKMDKTPCQDV